MAAASARRATELDKTNYLNWIALGKVGESVVPLKNVVAGSYELASNSYNQALVLNSKNPSIYLNLANLEIAKGDIKKGREYIAKALEKKSNYTAAIFLLSQIEAEQGNIPEAINKAEQARILAPQDLGVLFQLGFLKYMSKDYTGAVDALGAAVSIRSNYSNAKYFLGLSLSKLGKTADAIQQFKDIKLLNPDNKEIEAILSNLEAGRGALENITTPKNVPKEPEKRKTLPVKDAGDSAN
jgi:tetratricopeptide (TPR) repeat protein